MRPSTTHPSSGRTADAERSRPSLRSDTSESDDARDVGRLCRVGGDYLNRGEPAVAEGEALDKLHVVSVARRANDAALAADEHDDISFGEHVQNLGALLIDGIEVVRKRVPHLLHAVRVGNPRELKRREDLKLHVAVRLLEDARDVAAAERVDVGLNGPQMRRLAGGVRS